MELKRQQTFDALSADESARAMYVPTFPSQMHKSVAFGAFVRKFSEDFITLDTLAVTVLLLRAWKYSTYCSAEP